MANWLVGERVLSQESSDHVSLDLDLVPVLTTVAFDNGSAHLWDDDAVSKMSLDGLWLLSNGTLLLGNSKLLDQSVILGVDSVLESSSLSGLHHGDDLSKVHFEELIKLDTSVNLLLEGLLLWLLL